MEDSGEEEDALEEEKGELVDISNFTIVQYLGITIGTSHTCSARVHISQ